MYYKLIKKLSLLLAFVLMCTNITGCSNSDGDVVLPYVQNDSVARNNSMIYSQTPKAGLFAKSLAVVTGSNSDGLEDITASAALMINKTDKKVLYESGSLDKLYPASITKILTALVVLQEDKLDDTIVVSKAAVELSWPGAKMCGFDEGDTISMKDMLYALLLHSGNDAGVAIADHISGSEEEFTKLMNKTAKKLGANHSNFVNSHGLPNDEHYTSAYDLYLIFNECLKYDEFKEIIKTKSYTMTYQDKDGNEKTMDYNNTNMFLNGTYKVPNENITVLGGKTGTTDKAGKCLILYSIDSLSNKEYISVILRSDTYDNLYKQMGNLLNLAK